MREKGIYLQLRLSSGPNANKALRTQWFASVWPASSFVMFAVQFGREGLSGMVRCCEMCPYKFLYPDVARVRSLWWQGLGKLSGKVPHFPPNTYTKAFGIIVSWRWPRGKPFWGIAEPVLEFSPIAEPLAEQSYEDSVWESKVWPYKPGCSYTCIWPISPAPSARRMSVGTASLRTRTVRS